jgi:hypothetical protein
LEENLICINQLYFNPTTIPQFFNKFLTAKVRLEVLNGNSRQLHDLVWNQQYAGGDGHGTVM